MHFASLAHKVPASRSFASSRKQFSFEDPLNTQALLTEDEKQITSIARRYAQTQLMPRILVGNREGIFDKNILAEMGSLGLLGASVPSKDFLPISSVAYGLVAREIEKIDSSYRSAMSVQSSLVIFPIATYGTQAQIDKYLPSLRNGSTIGCFGLTEPDHGSDPSSMKTNAKKIKGGYLLNGSKTWITNSPIANVFIIWARVDEEKTFRAFIVERGFEGLETPTIGTKFSLRASITGSIFLSNVFVPQDNVLQTTGLGTAFSCLSKARYGISFGVLGAAEFCLNEAKEYANNRLVFGKPLSSCQLVQRKLADSLTEISLAMNACVHVGRLIDKGICPHPVISMLKMNSCAKSLEIARKCRDIMGANGISDEYHVIRHLMNLETVNTYEGTNDIHALIIGKAITGISAF